MHSLSPGTIVDGRYRIETVLGSGGFGVVYSAQQLGLERSVALKILQLEALGDPENLRRFQIEAEALSQLQHSHINRFFGYGVWQKEIPYIALGYLNGITLQQLVFQKKRLGWQNALRIARDVADALSHAHANGIVHRDIKPSNIFITKTAGRPESVTVTDFGLAKVCSSGANNAETATGLLVGTPGFMSPELLIGERADAFADIYALGCVMFFCLFGSHPYNASTFTEIALKHIHEPIPLAVPDAKNRAIAGAIEVIRRAMQKNKSDRFVSMLSMRDTIDEILQLESNYSECLIPLSLRVRSDPRAEKGMAFRSTWFLATACSVVLAAVLMVSWAVKIHLVNARDSSSKWQTDLKAGEVALDHWNDGEALLLLQRAFSEAGPQVKQQRRYCDLLFAFGQACYRARQLDKASWLIKQQIALLQTFDKASGMLPDAYRILSIIANDQGEFDKALQYASKGLALARTASKQSAAVFSLKVEIALAYAGLGRQAQSRQYLELSLAEWQSKGSAQNTSDQTVNQLSQILNRLDGQPAFLPVFQQMMDRIFSTSGRPAPAKVQLLQAQFLLRKHLPVQALAACLALRDQPQLLDEQDKIHLGNCFEQIAKLAAERHQWPEQLTALGAAKNVYSSTFTDRQAVAVSCMENAEACNANKQYRQARQIALMAYELCPTAENEEFSGGPRITTFDMLAKIDSALHDWPDMEKFSILRLDMLGQKRELGGAAEYRAQRNLGWSELGLRNYKQALPALRRACQLAHALGRSASEKAQMLLAVGEANLQTGDLPAAESSIKEGLHLSAEAGVNEVLREHDYIVVEMILSCINQNEMGRAKETLEFVKHYPQLKNRIYALLEKQATTYEHQKRKKEAAQMRSLLVEKQAGDS